MKRFDLRKFVTTTVFGALVVGIGLMTAQAAPTATAGASAEHARIVEHWTSARVAAAIPRDLVIDERGQGYLRKPDGSLEPYGNRVADAAKGGQAPNAKPGGGGDNVGPSVTPTDPGPNAIIGASHTFNATVTDASSTVRSVSFKVARVGSLAQSFTASLTSNNVYVVSLQGFTDGDWTWSVVAKDSANNTTTTASSPFKVSTSTGGGGVGDTDVVTNSEWTFDGTVQTAAGRIYFEMPSNSRKTRWAGYVCSGTVAKEAMTGRSVIQTAAHCVYDDAYKAFARNVLFIPNQANTSGAGTDLNCDNDPLGCWSASYGVVDVNWTTRTFPDNVDWDYAYYVILDTAHDGSGEGGALDEVAGSLPINFGMPFFEVANSSDDYTRALGYSYSDDPNFMYCAEDLTLLDDANWWLPSCGLSGGSSGGLWAQRDPTKPTTEVGSIISVNSWGYTNQPGMAGPKLSGNSATCVFDLAKAGNLTGTPADGAAGLFFDGTCPVTP